MQEEVLLNAFSFISSSRPLYHSPCGFDPANAFELTTTPQPPGKNPSSPIL